MNRRAPVLAAVCCLALAACGQPKAAPPARQLRLAFVTNDASAGWAATREGCNRAAADLPHVALDFQLLPDGSAATQKRVVDDLLARGTDGIAICPVDPAVQAPMLRDAARQTLLFTVGSDAPDSGRACFVGAGAAAFSPSAEAGRVAVATMSRVLQGDRAAIPPGGRLLLPP